MRPVPWLIQTFATSRLGWSTKRSLAEMCRDGWAWQQANPKGYSR